MWFADGLTRGEHRAALLSKNAVLLPPRGEACAVAVAAPAADEAAWRPALSGLLQALKTGGARPGRLGVSLGADFVRWQLVDWPASVGSPEELAAAVRMRLRAVHGTAVGAWHILHADGPPGQPVPVCAIDTALLQALRQELRDIGWRLTSLQPYAGAAFDHWRGRWRRGPAWVAVVEPGHLTLALFEHGRWRGLRSVRCHGTTPDAWHGLMTGLQAQMALQVDAPLPAEVPVWVLGPAVDVSGRPGWRALTPEGDTTRRDGLARLAWGR